MNETSGPDTIIADALRGHWADRLLPSAVRPFARLARLERPIGWWLLLLPCWFGQLLAQVAAGGGLPDLWHSFLFFAGAVVMRGAGCTWNDITDRNFDGRVSRTQRRPIPAGEVSLLQAFVFLAGLGLAGLAVLVQFNRYTIILGVTSLLIVAVYPFMKRITYWPQLFLGLAFNWGALVGWSASQGSLALPALLLYAGGIFWTLAYDTIYAHQDKEDDALIGIKSTALKFGAGTRPWLFGFFAAALLFFDAAIWQAGGGPAAHLGIAAAAGQALWQLWRFDGSDAALCLALFRANRVFGIMIAAGLLADCLLA